MRVRRMSCGSCGGRVFELKAGFDERRDLRFLQAHCPCGAVTRWRPSRPGLEVDLGVEGSVFGEVGSG